MSGMSIRPDVLLCCALQVKGYPTLKVFHKGEEVKAYR
jgi:hypothetical protein